MLALLIRFLITSLVSVFMLVCNGQVKQSYTCGDEQLKTLLRTVDTAYDNMQIRSNLHLKDYINNVLDKKQGPDLIVTESGDSSYVIPVVIHVVYPAGTPYASGTNISYAQIRSQIEALNAAFSKGYPGYNGQSHPAYAADTRIRFCLARNTQDTTSWALGPGGMEYGVRRYANNTGAYNHNITMTSANELMQLTHPSLNSFPFNKYLNIWLVSTINGGNNVMGYAPRPIMPGYLLDGVVMRADIFGDNTTGAGYNLGFGLAQGKVLAHEVGHYLNLYHIFQGGCAGANPAGAAQDACDLNGDMICDIEPSTTQNIYCTGDIPNSCTANYVTGTTHKDMINDYMSYADDDCMNTFTADQVKRMWATLQLQRSQIWQPENLIATGIIGNNGCVPPFLNPQIKAENTVFCAGKLIDFSNPAAGNTAITYEWRFAGGTPAISTSRTVAVTYTQPGNYTAVLKVSNGTNTRTDSMTFAMLGCKIDSSMLSMSHWYFGNFGSLDFTVGAPVQTTTAFNNRSIQGELAYSSQPGAFVQGTVSLSDSMGKLLFYSNGVSVWNKNHQKITSAPMFGASDINASTGICYIPFPGKKSNYFVAGVYPNFDETPSGVRFVLIDVDSNTVQPYRQFRHPSLPNRYSQLLTVVPHCNGNDYWIITKGYGSNTNFYSFLVRSAGIDDAQAPVISTGFNQTAFGGSGYQMKANRLGTRLILTSPAINSANRTGAMYDFDSRTGKLTNEKLIPDAPGYSNIQTGVAFSPNGKYFYLLRSSNFATNGLPYWLFQYRVSDFAYNVITAPGFYFASPLQPGPDGQIYVTTQDHMVARISNPDEWGAFTFNGAFINMRRLNDNIRTGVSMPAFIDARRQSPSQPDFSVLSLNCNTFRFSSLCFDNYTANWNFGDGSPLQTGNVVTHQFSGSGTFNVTLSLTAGAVAYGAVAKVVHVLPITAGITGPDVVCSNGNNPSQYFASLQPNASYRWTVLNGGKISGADNFPFADVIWDPAIINGTVQLELMSENCIVTSSKTISIVKGPTFSWTLPDSICLFDSTLILKALPEGGSFAGKGIRNNAFSPSLAGVGFHTITYTYFDETTCLGQIEKTIKVARCKIPTDQNTDCELMLNSISVAPNPVADRLQLKSPYVLKYANVYNSIGQKVATNNLFNNSMRVSNLAAGFYRVLVYCENNSSYKSFSFLKIR